MDCRAFADIFVSNQLKWTVFTCFAEVFVSNTPFQCVLDAQRAQIDRNSLYCAIKKFSTFFFYNCSNLKPTIYCRKNQTRDFLKNLHYTIQILKLTIVEFYKTIVEKRSGSVTKCGGVGGFAARSAPTGPALACFQIQLWKMASSQI